MASARNLSSTGPAVCHLASQRRIFSFSASLTNYVIHEATFFSNKKPNPVLKISNAYILRSYFITKGDSSRSRLTICGIFSMVQYIYGILTGSLLQS
jgi:hypothetical protein